MASDTRSAPTALVIFGSGGDLTWRKLVPALFNLSLQKILPEPFVLIGVDRVDLSTEAWCQHLRQGVTQFSRSGQAQDGDWDSFATCLTYVRADFATPAMYTGLSQILAKFDQERQTKAHHVFYLATPPTLFSPIARLLADRGAARERARARIVLEKPLGYDLTSARELNRSLTEHFHESQIFRIDHYLGKETVQNILALRFANPVFEPIWNRRYIDYVTITVAEEVGVEHRGGYYDHAGALRDMIQNHLLQVLCMVAMEPPVSFQADEIRNKKADVLHAIRPIPYDAVHMHAARGQYGDGWVKGQSVLAYRNEAEVAPASNTETFAALKLFVDNWRWHDVPFYLRTGKRLARHVSEVSIHFRPVPHRSFPAEASLSWQPARLVICIQPDEGIVLKFQAKQPGQQMLLRPVDMHFSYRETFQTPSPDAYETLLWDAMRDDATLFMRADQVETAWSVLMPILEVWGNSLPSEFPNYAAGTWGPETATELIARDRRSWPLPTVLADHGQQKPNS